MTQMPNNSEEFTPSNSERNEKRGSPRLLRGRWMKDSRIAHRLINPFGSYSNENIVLVCWLVNHMKRQQTHNEFVSLCRLIADNH